MINSGDSVAFQKGQISVVAWLEKKRRKTVLNASTTTDSTSAPVTASRKQNDGRMADVPCPQTVKQYNEKMQGVDWNDALCVKYSTARMARCWWLYIFYFLFDLSVANSFILMKESPNRKLYTKAGAEKPRKLIGFRKNLAEQLIGDYRENHKRPSCETALKPVNIGL